MKMLSVISLFPMLVFAWDFTQERNTNPVYFNNIQCQSPWNTGWNYIQPIFGDIDNDGDQDSIFGGDWNKVVLSILNDNNICI
jgi:hypothetical protein